MEKKTSRKKSKTHFKGLKKKAFFNAGMWLKMMQYAKNYLPRNLQ